ncbi:hypothetical protein ET464_00010 [Paenibacillus protaetiae]|uniref:Uncharacterized protein n=1 Tax=Paenibacillus protaetiae TaxID=2509456 RepID=A0A4P6EYV7_9BACL|nr:hypothetical protein ET464_00010 [Paenibacillus protaetiae]
MGYLFSTFWPVILIWIGLRGLFGGLASRNGSGLGGVIILLLGITFLGHNLGWFAWSLGEIFTNLWPVGVILIGIHLLWRPRRRHEEERPFDEWKTYGKFNEDDEYDYDVPPAPPLHPDPTKKSGEDAGISGEESGSSFSFDASPKESHNDEAPLRIPSFEEWKHQVKNGKHHYKRYKDQVRAYKHYYRRQKHHYKHHYRHQYKHHYKEEYWDSQAQNRSGFIGDIHIGHDYWELKPLNISHFIGDTVLDLTKAQIPFGETKINVSSFVGDVKVFVPNDMEVGVQVVSSSFAGDVKILGRKEGGMFHSVNYHTTGYHEMDKKIKLVVSTFVGDVRVTKVG